MESIDSFRGEYRFLSNFYPVVVHMDGLDFPSVEHAFQAAKTLDGGEREKIRTAKTPGDAKRRGRRAALRSDWEKVKDSVMESLIHHKFSYKVLAADLIATGDVVLIEGNTWGDKTWGMVKDVSGKWVGENRLGKILMKERERLRASS